MSREVGEQRQTHTCNWFTSDVFENNVNYINVIFTYTANWNYHVMALKDISSANMRFRGDYIYQCLCRRRRRHQHRFVIVIVFVLRPQIRIKTISLVTEAVLSSKGLYAHLFQIESNQFIILSCICQCLPRNNVPITDNKRSIRSYDFNKFEWLLVTYLSIVASHFIWISLLSLKPWVQWE